jgi:hypothetical protein
MTFCARRALSRWLAAGSPGRIGIAQHRNHVTVDRLGLGGELVERLVALAGDRRAAAGEVDGRLVLQVVFAGLGQRIAGFGLACADLHGRAVVARLELDIVGLESAATGSTLDLHRQAGEGSVAGLSSLRTLSAPEVA